MGDFSELFELRLLEDTAVAADPYAWHAFLAAIEDRHPQYQDNSPGGQVCPPAMVTAWTRPWSEIFGEGHPVRRPLELHHRLKEIFGYPFALVEENEIAVHADVHAGDHIAAEQHLAILGPEEVRNSRTGRRWIIELSYRTNDGTPVATERIRFFAYKHE